jgi:CHAT domain-containing protein/tetratricopeptide (TPR) repeat protein
MTSLALACLGTLAACTDHSISQRTILERQGTLNGLSQQSFEIDVLEGQVLLILLDQSGLDLKLSATESNNPGSDAYDSATGRYGHERVQLTVANTGRLEIVLSATRKQNVSGSFRIVVSEVPAPDPADASFTRASHADLQSRSAERIRLFSAASESFGHAGKSRESGIAALAALRLVIDTASDEQEALRLGNKAVEALRKSGDDSLLLAVALSDLAVAQGEARQLEEMAKSIEQARLLYEANDSRIGIAEGRTFKAVAEYAAGDSQDHLATFAEIAVECAELRERTCEAMARMDAGILHRDRGEYEAAFGELYRALQLIDATEDPGSFATINDNIAFSLRMVGDFDSAILHHERAMAAYARFGECSGLSRSLYGMGYSLLGVGDEEKALRFYRLSLERGCSVADLATAAPKLTGFVNTLSALCEKAASAVTRNEDDRVIASWVAWDLGNLARAHSDPKAALACHEVGTRLANTNNYRLGTKLERVRDLLDAGRTQDAQELFSELEPGIKGSHPWYRAQATDVDAQLKEAAGATMQALSSFGAAADEYRIVGNFEGVFAALSRRAAIARQSGDKRTVDFYVDADAALEHVRLLSLDPGFSASLFASGRRIYGDWIEYSSKESVASPAERDLATLALSERSRSRLLSQIAKVFKVGAGARAARLRSVAAGATAVLENSESGKMDSAVPAVDPTLQIERDLGLATQRYDAAGRKASMAKLRDYQSALDDQTTVIEYFLGEARSHAWVMRRNVLVRIDLAPAVSIRTAVHTARASLAPGTSDAAAKQALSILNDLVFRPLEPLVRGGKLLIVPDDALHEATFAAFWDARQEKFLVERFAISYLPSIEFAASRAGRSSNEEGPVTALLVGDPVYESDDAHRRCKASPGSLVGHQSSMRRLPASGREIKQISDVIQRRNGTATALTGCDANRGMVLRSQLSRFRFIHFATHATVDRAIPQRSAIYLSAFDEHGRASESQLSAADLLDNPIKVQLVVLSGCSTAGGWQFSGEGSLGLAFSLIAGGSKNVISTLWPVADAASAAAMTTLYDNLLAGQLETSEALRASQLAMLSGERWRHPRHWAAYSQLGT